MDRRSCSRRRNRSRRRRRRLTVGAVNHPPTIEVSGETFDQPLKHRAIYFFRTDYS